MKRTVRRRATLVGLTTTAVLVLAGCSGTPEGGGQQTAAQTPGEVSGTLTILIQGSADTAAKSDVLAEGFKKEFPDVTVKTEYDPSTNWQQFFTNVQTRLAAGKEYDLIYLPTEGERLFASKGLLTPLDTWIERDEAEMDAFYAEANASIVEDAKALASTDGRTYFIPYIYNTMGMYVNRATFEKAGVALPGPDWTWDDFRKTCEQLKAAGVEFCFNAETGFFTGIEPWLKTNGASVLNEDWTRATTDDPKAIESVSFVRGLVQDGLAPEPGGSNSTNFDPNALFSQGKIAMVGGGAWITTSLLDAGVPMGDMQIVPWPKNTQNGSPVGWGGLGLMKTSPNKEAAWQYIKYLLSPEAQDTIGEQRYNGALPVLKSSIEKAAPSNVEGYSYLYDALDYATPVPGPAAAVLVQQVTADAYTSVLSGNTTPEEGMKELNTKLQDAIAEK